MNEQPEQKNKKTTGYLAPQAWMTAPETVKVMDALTKDGGDARFVGGAVRNALLNRSVIDIDIATPLLPSEVMDRLSDNNIDYVPTGLQHGTVTAIVDGKPFEITTLRRDVVTHGRTAEVAFTEDWRKDASRRDLTINALYATRDGEVYDYFDGLSDLKAGRVIFVGDPVLRIHEDHLRILRFFRFYALYGRGEADARALDAAIRHAKLVTTLSRERIRNEIMKLLESDRAGEVWRLMSENGVVTHFLPEATRLAALEKVIALEEKLHRGGYVLRRLASVLDTTKDGLRRITDQLRLSREQGRALALIVLIAPTLKNNVTAEQVRALVYRYGNEMAESMLIVASAWGGDFDVKALHEMAESFRAPRFPVNGDDLTARGLIPGPLLGRVLQDVENWWVDQDFKPGRSETLQEIDRRLLKKA